MLLAVNVGHMHAWIYSVKKLNNTLEMLFLIMKFWITAYTYSMP